MVFGTWRSALREASFRGVKFYVSQAESAHGRRWAGHEYPGRDFPFREDMGRRERQYRFTAYILEPRHIDRGKRLVAACEAPGAATLVHPWLGECQVVCTDCRQTYSADPSAIANFSLEFVEAGEARYPESVTNNVSAVDASVFGANESLLDDFGKGFDLINMPNALAEDAVGLIREYTSGIRAFIEPVLIGAQAAAHWTRTAIATYNEVSFLARNPVALGERILSILDIGNVGALTGLVQYSLELAGGGVRLSEGRGKAPLYKTFAPLTTWTPAQSLIEIRPTTPFRIQQLANREVFLTFARSAATLQAARSAIREDYKTYEDATTARDFIVARLEEQAEASTDSVYRSLIDVRTEVMRGISAKAPTLPKVIPYTPLETMPALVIANILYGDNIEEVPDRADEIVARNRVRNPLFVIGGQQIMILSTD